jgi:formylglycine-generating enzyme required for sulfatase activity
MFLDRKEETMKTRRITTAGLVALCGMAQAAFVTIGDPGNTADTAGYGAVGYTYRISATEVTIAEFQASGAGSGNENHWNDGTRTVGANAPASYVSLYEAMKYCNYLTSGDVNTGYYSTSDGGSTYQANALSHDAYAAANGPAYFLPTEDEWYKAAYFKPDASGYSLYANGTDTVPTHGTPEGWNYFNGGYVNSSPNYTWTTGFGGEEQNGTYDMMGNVWERMETSSGVARGGSFGNSEDFLRSSHRHDSYGPSLEFNALGVRVVAVPEPATMGLLAISGLVIAGHRRVRKHDSL